RHAEMKTGIRRAWRRLHGGGRPLGARRDRGPGLRRRWLSCPGKLAFQRRDAGFEGLVLLAGQARHVLDRLEFLALDEVEVAHPPLGLAPEHGIELALDPLRDAGGIVHEAGDFVEEPVAGLGHGEPRLNSQVICPSIAGLARWRRRAIYLSLVCKPVCCSIQKRSLASFLGNTFRAV